MAEKQSNVSDAEWRRNRTSVMQNGGETEQRQWCRMAEKQNSVMQNGGTTSVTLAAGFATCVLSLPAFQQDLGASLRWSVAALQQHPPVFIPLNSAASNFAVR